MHDIKAIRDNPDLYEQAWSAKGRSGVVAEALALDATLRAAQTALQEAQSRRNDLSKQIGQAKGRKELVLVGNFGDLRVWSPERWEAFGKEALEDFEGGVDSLLDASSGPVSQ